MRTATNKERYARNRGHLTQPLFSSPTFGTLLIPMRTNNRITTRSSGSTAVSWGWSSRLLRSTDVPEGQQREHNAGNQRAYGAHRFSVSRTRQAGNIRAAGKQTPRAFS